MDAFSRLLATIGQSLGKGLGQVGQTELEQRQRLEVLEAQRKANISGQLLQTFTQLLNTQGIQEVDPEGIEAIKRAVTDLALGKIDSPAVQKAIEVFPTVAASANKIAVYRELATKDLDALSRLVANTPPEEAQKFLSAVGLGGMYEGLRARGEILTEADRLGLQLTREQIENLAAQRKALLEKLGPEIRLLEQQGRLTAAEADKILATLPLLLTRLQLEAQNLAVQVKKGEIEASKLDQVLDARIKEDLAKAGFYEAKAEVLREQIGLIREQIKSEVLRQAQIEAETERIKAETELTRERTKLIIEQIKSEAQRRGIELTKAALEWLEDIAKLAFGLSAETPEEARELLKAFGSFYSLPEDFINLAANRIAVAVREAKADKDLQRTGALAKAIRDVMETSMAAESPEAARKVAEAMLPPMVSPELKALVGNMAYYLKTLRLGADIATVVEPYMKVLPQTPEDESRLLRRLYDSIIGLKGDTPEGRRIANGLVNTVKGQWALTRTLQSLEQESKRADIDKDKALAALYRVQAALAPKQFGLEEQKLALQEQRLAFEREQFTFEKWYKTEQVKLGWARLELDKLIAEAKAAGASDDVIKALKDLASVAKTADDLATRALANRLRQLGKDSCARKLESAGSITILEAVRADDRECNEAIRQILTDKTNEDNKRVAEQAERAVELGRYVTNLALSFVSGGATPGGATPTTPGAGGGPSGTAAPGSVTTPKPQDGATGLRRKAAELRQAGVTIPNDPKVAGAMTFIYALEGGPADNPFQIIPASGVAPTGPDKGFSAAVKAEPTRQKAIEIDSAPALGVSWFLPTLARNPGVKVRYLDPKIVEANRPLFERARYFGDDGIAVAAAYTAGALERAGFEIKYTPLFTTLMRALAENDLSVLRMRKPLSQAEAEQRFLNLVKSRYGSKYREFGFSKPEELIDTARNLYRATRLSTIGQIVLGGGR